MSHRIHRRQFLSMMGLSTVMLATSKLHAQDAAPTPLPVSAAGTATETEREVLTRIRANIEAKFADRVMGLDFRRINTNGDIDFRITINEDKFFPVASAFKAYLILYYFWYTPEDKWEATTSDSVYRVAVYSNNYLTGVLLADTAEYVEGDGNPIEKFNDFLTKELGMKYGIYTWSWPSTPTRGILDQRFKPVKERIVEARGRTAYAENVSTAEDLARGWTFIAQAEHDTRWNTDEHFRKSILATREILSIPAVSYRSPIERELYGGYIGKDGTLPLGDFVLGRVLDDAGLVRVEDGFYLISFMSTTESEQSTGPALSEVISSINVYQDFLHPRRELVILGEGAPLVDDQSNYGFVRSNSIPLYLEPNSQAERVDNPVRRTSIYGTPYLMRGALLRVLPVDDNWGKVVVDNDVDDVFTYLDWTYALQPANWANWNMYTRQEVYVPLEHLKMIGPEQTSPIEFALDHPEPVVKWIMLHVPKRQLTLFEGLTPILKTPIVLNSLATPRGRLYVNRVMVARNMPTYPGVPYTNFLHNGLDLHEHGFAIHGAPWHIWEENVTEWETIRRYSHGCINIPNWSLPIGKYELPVDEFIFRWIGGYPNPGGPDNSHYKGRDTVRILSVNNPYEDLFYFSVVDAVRLLGGDWNDALAVWKDKTIDAPERFFVKAYDKGSSEESVLNLQAPGDDEN